MQKWIKFCEYVLFIVFLIVILFLKQKIYTLVAIPIIIGIHFLIKKVNIKNFGLFIFFFTLMIRIISIIVLKVNILDDFKTMYEASLMLLKGDLSFMNGFYFKTYPYQLGLVLYQAILLKLWKNVIVLKIMNSIYTSLIVYFIYKISKSIWKESSARMISLAYAIYLYPIYLNSVLTNQHIQSLLMMIVLYILIKKEESIKWYSIIALLLAFSNFFRAESIIFILGIIVYNIGYLKKDNIKKKGLCVLSLLVVYFVCTTLTTVLLNNSVLFKNTDETTVDKNVTLWKFYCGLNVEHNGIYNDEDATKYFTTNEEKELLISRIKEDYKKYPILFLKKEVILWTQTNYDLAIQNKWNQKLRAGIENYNQGFLNVILILFVVSLFPKKKEEKKEFILLKIVIALYFGIYLFIEISPRYAYILHMLVFIVLAEGIEKLTEYWNLKKKEKKA